MNIRHLRTDAAASVLLPPGDGRVRLVMLVTDDAEDELVRCAARAASFHSDPLHVLHLSGAPDVARWFGLGQTPITALAVISDGALLALSPEVCSEVSAAQLLETARSARGLLSTA